jgi:hypothetical protein
MSEESLMRTRHHNSIKVLIPLLGLAACHAALAAKPVKVQSADPAESWQNTTETVTIRGSGFDTKPDAVTAINFLLPCTTDPCTTETGGVTVEPDNWIVNSSEEIVAIVDVDEQAIVDSRDIEVLMTRGRGGKGTTLFKVWSSDPCDRDGDNWRKNNASCDLPGYEGIDCDDQDETVQACEPPDGGDTFTETIIRAGFVDAISATLLEEASPYQGPYVYPDEHPFGSGWNNWDANTLTETPRPCGPLQISDPTAGRYDCFENASNGSQWPHGGRVSINILGMAWQPAEPPKRGWKNPELCDLIESFGDLRMGATRYQIFFTEGCDYNGGNVDCPMAVGVASYSGSANPSDNEVVQLHDFHGIDGYPDIGRLVLRAFVNEDSIAFPPAGSGELNMFTEPQELVIDWLRVSFESVKNGATLAICETVPGTVSGLEVWTWPEPYQP